MRTPDKPCTAAFESHTPPQVAKSEITGSLKRHAVMISISDRRHTAGWTEFAPDSPLEESGFELLVPPGKGTASFEANLINRRHLLLPENQARGTEGSNPLSSSGESGANMIFGNESHR